MPQLRATGVCSIVLYIVGSSGVDLGPCACSRGSGTRETGVVQTLADEKDRTLFDHGMESGLDISAYRCLTVSFCGTVIMSWVYLMPCHPRTRL